MTPLTIPEDLKLFVDPDHSFLSPLEIKIIRHLSGHVILNNRLQNGINMIRQIKAENAALSEPRHGLIIGESGCGKTTLLDILKAQMPPRSTEFRLGIREHIPALMLSLPSTITPRSMACQMLRAIGDTSSLNGTCFALTERLCDNIQSCGVEVLFLDEFHALLGLGRGTAKGANRRLIESRNWIKSVINRTHVTFVLMGMPESVALIEDEDQLERRFTHLYMLDPFNKPTPADTEMADFVDTLLIEAVTELPGFTTAEFLADRPDDAKRLYVATAGVPSRLKDLVIRAALNAHRRGSSAITMVDFTAGFEQGFRSRMMYQANKERRARRKTLLQALDGRLINPFAAANDVINQIAMQMAA